MNTQDRLADEDALRDCLLARLKEKSAELRALLEKMERHWGIEDGVYRFYHQSLKVYYVQEMTQEAVELLQSLLLERPLNAWFMQIVSEGTGKKFELSHNDNWLHHTRPMVEALFHAHYFVKMACKYGQELEAQPLGLPNGYAALLYLFDLR
jgi:hypothetical protein